jgi:hypothetical protein
MPALPEADTSIARMMDAVQMTIFSANSVVSVLNQRDKHYKPLQVDSVFSQQLFPPSRVSVSMKARVTIYFMAAAILIAYYAPARALSYCLCTLRRLALSPALKSFFFGS